MLIAVSVGDSSEEPISKQNLLDAQLMVTSLVDILLVCSSVSVSLFFETVYSVGDSAWFVG